MSSTPEQLRTAAAYLQQACALSRAGDARGASGAAHEATRIVNAMNSPLSDPAAALSCLASYSEWRMDPGRQCYIVRAVQLSILLEAAQAEAVPACPDLCAEMGGREGTALICSARGCQRERMPNWAGMVEAFMEESRP